MKKVISFSVYGNSHMYLLGAIENAKLKNVFFPDWHSTFYVAEKLKGSFANELSEHADEIQFVEGAEDPRAMFWRFLPAADSNNDAVIVRDVDSRLNAKDLSAVNEWLDSGKALHVIRDHPMHNAPILGGLWGIRPATLPEFHQSLSSFIPRGYYGEDQEFLRKYVYEPLRTNCFVHDEIFLRNLRAHNFLVNNLDSGYLGESVSDLGEVNEALRKMRTETMNSRIMLSKVKIKSIIMQFLGK
jgi:hypothetical protein